MRPGCTRSSADYGILTRWFYNEQMERDGAIWKSDQSKPKPLQLNIALANGRDQHAGTRSQKSSQHNR